MPDPKILFEDPHLLVLSKPAGLLSQGEHKGDPNLVDWLRVRLGRPYVGLVHRLDRNTSGLMVVAKRTKAANRLTEALQAGEIQRIYLAWIHGKLAGPMRWKHTLFKDRQKNVVRVVTSAHPQGQEAVLVVTPLSAGVYEGEPLTLVQFELETGRSHQIRVQAAHEGHPLLGDVKYAAATAAVAGTSAARTGSRSRSLSRPFGRPALHSARLKFSHPMTAQVMEFEDPMPEDMRRIERQALN